MEDPSNVGPGIVKTGTGQWEGYNNGLDAIEGGFSTRTTAWVYLGLAGLPAKACRKSKERDGLHFHKTSFGSFSAKTSRSL